jgi:hypothetical protein
VSKTSLNVSTVHLLQSSFVHGIYSISAMLALRPRTVANDVPMPLTHTLPFAIPETHELERPLFICDFQVACHADTLLELISC